MIRFRCPICGKQGEVAALDDLPSFPFCSDRCRLVDLGRWIDGAYAIPDKAPAGMAGPDAAEEDEDDG